MKRVCTFVSMIMLLACNATQQGLRKNAEELFSHIPETENLEGCKAFLTDDFYASVEEMVSLPDFTPVVKARASEHPVRQPGTDEHFLQHTALGVGPVQHRHLRIGRLLADFDDAKQSCVRYIDNYRKEESARKAISDYLVNEIGTHYLQGEVCIPVIMIVAAEEEDATHARVWGDFWVDWYNVSGDTLKTVSGGNHSGCMSLIKDGDKLSVTAFEQTEDGAGNDPSARRIFGKYYDIYHSIHSNQDARESARKEAIRHYCTSNGLDIKYYQDFGWPAVSI